MKCVCIFVCVHALVCILYIERVVFEGPSEWCGRAQRLWLWRALKLIQQCQPDILFLQVFVFLVHSLFLSLSFFCSPLFFFIYFVLFFSFCGSVLPFLSHPLSHFSYLASLSLSLCRMKGVKGGPPQNGNTPIIAFWSL